MPASRRRLWEIDALRGLMLLMMLFTHLPSRVTSAFGQPFGYVSAAEGFVLLSAFMTGMFYGRLEEPGRLRNAFLRRALKIYGCQVAALCFLFTVMAFIGQHMGQSAVTNLMSFYLQMPATAVGGSLLLVYQPPLLDILPLYILFMLASPALIALARRQGWEGVMAASVVIWLLTQFGLSEWLYARATALFSLSVPYRETGAFSIWAWQFLWVLGLWMGMSRHRTQAAAFGMPRWAVLLAVGITLAGCGWRHVTGQVPFHDDNLNLLFDKWTLGPLRLISLFALMVLIIRFGDALTRWLPRQRWLETLGAASLSVFCAHLVLVLLVLGLLGDDYERPWELDLPLLLASCALLYLVARTHLHLKARPQPATTAPGMDMPPVLATPPASLP